MWKTPKELADFYGVTRQTIFNWINDGKFDRIQKTKGNHNRIWVETDHTTIGYCRISSSEQKSSLDTQEEIIRKKYPKIRIVKDIGSGFNFKRKEFKAILEQCLQGTSIKIVATTQDRITRTGFEFIKWIIELYGGSIELLENKDSTDESFDTETLISFITSFVNSYYGKRSSNRNKKDKTEN